MRVRTPHTGSPRVPAPWQSAPGEAGPKARPQRRSRWPAGEYSRPVLQPLKPRGTVERRGSGHVDWPSNGVGFGRDRMARIRGDPGPSVLESTREKSSRGRLRDVRTVNRHRWARRVASGERVKRGQGTRHNDPVTSEEGMPALVPGLAPGARAGRSESAQATV